MLEACSLEALAPVLEEAGLFQVGQDGDAGRKT